MFRDAYKSEICVGDLSQRDFYHSPPPLPLTHTTGKSWRLTTHPTIATKCFDCTLPPLCSPHSLRPPLYFLKPTLHLPLPLLRMSNNASDDTSSISNQPLLPKDPEPKNFEAAAASLMSTYGFGGHVPKPYPKPSKTNKKKDKGKEKEKESASYVLPYYFLPPQLITILRAFL